MLCHGFSSEWSGYGSSPKNGFDWLNISVTRQICIRYTRFGSDPNFIPTDFKSFLKSDGLFKISKYHTNDECFLRAQCLFLLSQFQGYFHCYGWHLRLKCDSFEKLPISRTIVVSTICSRAYIFKSLSESCWFVTHHESSIIFVILCLFFIPYDPIVSEIS